MLAPLLASLAAMPSPQTDAVDLQALGNGDFQAPARPEEPRPIPWWQTRGDVEVVEMDGARALRITGDGIARQPIAFDAPRAADLTLTGEVLGAGSVLVRDGSGASGSIAVHSDGEGWAEFQVGPDELERVLGHAPAPRLGLELRSQLGAPVHWRALRVLASFPSPSRAELLAEIHALLEPVFDAWLERGLDDVGPRSTAFLVKTVDVVTGEPIAVGEGSIHLAYEQLLRLNALHPTEERAARLERFLDDLLAFGLHPDTGLPSRWDPVLDRRRDDEHVEIARTLCFLLDAVEFGPDGRRDACLMAARRIGDRVLAVGALPTGEIASLYRASDADPSTSVPKLRSLDVAAQLARLGAMTGAVEFRDAARRALVHLEFAHVWTGSVEAMDPGFNDFYGNLGARACDMWRAWPDEPMFRGFVLEGLEYYAPLWDRALVHGHPAAPDQVRAWEVCVEAAALAPELRPLVDARLEVAVRAHVQGQQQDGGAWAGTSFFAFEPNTDVRSGDMRSIPMNLIQGLALSYRHDLGPERGATLARFTAVMRATHAEFGREHGYLRTPRERASGNPSGAEFVFAAGLIEMLAGLEEAAR